MIPRSHRPPAAAWRRLARLLALAALVPAVAVCASAKKRYKQGQELEQRGSYADAAKRYIDALRKDERHEGARARLRETGDSAVADYVRRAASADSAGRAVDGAELFLSADALRRDARAVGTELDVPFNYSELRRGVLDHALAATLATGRALAERGEWDDAERRFVRAAERYEPTAEQDAQLASARFDALIAHAAVDSARGSFRSAHERAGRALALLAAGDPRAERARQLQAVALARGARRVAIVPEWAGDSVARHAPEDLLAALGDALLEEHWTSSSPWIAVTPPEQVRRELRRLGLSRRVLSSAEAGRLGRELGVDYVVVTELDSASMTDVDVKKSRRPARTRSGADTAYTLEEGRTRIAARVTFAIVDPVARRAVDDGSVSESRTVSFRRATYAGDPRTLELSRGDRDLFDADRRRRTERDAVRQLVDELSPKLAEAVYGRVQRMVE